VVTPKEGTDDYRLEEVIFSSTHDQRVPAYLTLPKQAHGPVPAIVYLHGHGGSKAEGLEVAGLLARTGRALIAIDAQYHGDRKREGVDIYSRDFYRMRDALIQTVVDARRAIDYLQTRPEINHDRIAVVGGSMGGILGALLAGVDTRVKAAILVVGGADWECLSRYSNQPVAARLRAEDPHLSFDRIGDILAPADPLYFAAHISPRPLLMQNGRLDETIPPSCAQCLYDAARDPKAIDWYQAGHQLPMELVVPRALAWLDKNL
jgi:dienelactone hydrolase